MTYVQPISVELSNGKRFTIEYNNENADIGEVREFAAGTILTINQPINGIRALLAGLT